MLVADSYRGRIEDLDADLGGNGGADGTAPDAEAVHVVIDDTERRRSRFRTTSVGGREVGVTVGRTLRDGDVLDADGTPVVVELEPIPALAVSLSDLEAADAVRFGHALGNRHRDLTVEDTRALVPIDPDDERQEADLRADLPAEVVVDRTTVPPSVFDDDREWDAGIAGTDATAESGSNSHQHSHGHGSHGHTHDHHQANGQRQDHDHGRGGEPNQTGGTDP
jgi:urease accessory protein